ncbi:MAG: type II TA system antitoxin MqsA family protein [Oligoflexales bacterium]
MKCYSCDNTKFEEVTKVGLIDFKDVKDMEYRYETYKCEVCGTCINDSNQQKQKVIAVADAYRQHKRLYTSSEIKCFRDSMEMSQDKFADFLGVGVASVRRWEGAGIQDFSQNEIIRLKCDEKSFSSQMIKQWENKAPNEYSGDRKFSIARLISIFSKYNQFAPSPLFFFKAVFYVDIHHYLNEGVSITGLNYECLDYGPIPKNYGIIRDYIKTNHALSIDDHDIQVGDIFDSQLFCESELKSIEYVEKILKDKGKKYIFERVHKHHAFKEHDYMESISYKSIQNVNI